MSFEERASEDDYSFKFEENFTDVIHIVEINDCTKCCNNTAIMPCVKIYSNLMTRNGFTADLFGNFVHTSVLIIVCLNSLRPSDAYMRR